MTRDAGEDGVKTHLLSSTGKQQGQGQEWGSLLCPLRGHQTQCYPGPPTAAPCKVTTQAQHPHSKPSLLPTSVASVAPLQVPALGQKQCDK